MTDATALVLLCFVGPSYIELVTKTGIALIERLSISPYLHEFVCSNLLYLCSRSANFH